MDLQIKFIFSALLLVEIVRFANDLLVVNRNYKIHEQNLKNAYAERDSLRESVKNLKAAIGDMIGGKMPSYVMTPSGFKLMTGLPKQEWEKEDVAGNS